MKIIITERQETILEGLIFEGKNKPTNPKLWSQCLSWARSRYDVCPSAYCNGAAAKRYKAKGGGWRKVKKSTNESEETNEASSPAQQAAIAINMKKKGIKPKNETIYEDEFGSVESIDYNEEFINEAEYQGRKVQLGKIMQGDVKKSKVYVKNDKGKVVKVNFGFGGKSAHGKRMVIKKNNPERRRNFRARMNCDNPGPRWKPRYWACRSW